MRIILILLSVCIIACVNQVKQEDKQADTQLEKQVDKQIASFCVPESIKAAWVWEVKSGQPSRIAIINVSPGLDHAQAEGWDGEKWVPLNAVASPVIASVPYGKPYRYFTLEDFIAEQKAFLSSKTTSQAGK